jgi:hypothetical protein
VIAEKRRTDDKLAEIRSRVVARGNGCEDDGREGEVDRNVNVATAGGLVILLMARCWFDIGNW